MADQYWHKDMYLEDIFLGMYETSTQELRPEMNEVVSCQRKVGWT